MQDIWWANKIWSVRQAGDLRGVLKRGDEFRLEPNTQSGAPLFFWFRSEGDGMHPGWKNQFFYSVGVVPYQIPMLPVWQEGNGKVSAQYDEAVIKVRHAAQNPYTARLEGRILVEHKWEIVRLFFFKSVQEDGNDWVVIDIVVSDTGSYLEDGTGHGDPK